MTSVQHAGEPLIVEDTVSRSNTRDPEYFTSVSPATEEEKISHTYNDGKPSIVGDSSVQQPGLQYTLMNHDDRGAEQAKCIKKWACFGSHQYGQDHSLFYLLKNSRLQCLLVTYHLARLALAINDYFSNGLCIWFALNILVGKFSTLSIYIFGLFTLRKEKLFPLITGSFQCISKTTWTLLFLTISVPYTTGIVVACTLKFSTEHPYLTAYHILIEVSDLLRYWPSSAVVLLLFGFLNTFSFKMENSRMENGKLDLSISKIDDWNHVEFMETFQTLTARYRTVVRQFQWFLLIFLIAVLLLWISIFVSIILDYFGRDCTYVYSEYIHYFSETIFYCLLWCLPIWKLHRCYEKLLRFKNDFIAKIAITDSRNAVQKVLIQQYLDVMTDNHSPFRIFGVNPGKKTMFALISSIALPILAGVLKHWVSSDLDLL